jgi:hypothetical protein
MWDSIKALLNIPDHWVAVGIVMVGTAVATSHLPHAYEAGSTLITGGLTAYRGKSAE